MPGQTSGKQALLVSEQEYQLPCSGGPTTNNLMSLGHLQEVKLEVIAKEYKLG